MNAPSVMSSLLIETRSRKLAMCGEVNKPTRHPACSNPRAIFVDTEPFPEKTELMFCNQHLL